VRAASAGCRAAQVPALGGDGGSMCLMVALMPRVLLPDGFFGGEGDALDLAAVGRGVAAGEHLFVNTYLLGVTTFAAAGRSEDARYAAELAACESEHRVLGQTLVGASLPNDLGFAEFEFDRVSQIAAAAQSAGFGFGEQGRPPVASTTFHGRRSPRRSRSPQTNRDRRTRRTPHQGQHLRRAGARPWMKAAACRRGAQRQRTRLNRLGGKK
jgi:hypothetical protein